MKGYLKSSQGLFLLAPKVTTVGREGCDLVIQSSSIDQQHALLEYLPEDECFVLQDLNSVHGTYVNDCRVENISIRLCAGDVIRFGKSSVKHELVIEQQQRVSYLPLNSHTAWAQPLTLMQDETHASDYVCSRGLPHLKTVVSTTTQFAQPPGAATTLPHPPPPSLRMRPLSAGSRRQYLDRTPTVGSQKAQNGSGWISGSSRGLQRSSSSSDLIALQEKEQKQFRLEEDLRRLEEEMQNLSHYETECRQKDVMIDQLYKENTQLQQRLKVAETKRVPAYQDSDITNKLRVLEREVAAKKDEVNELRNKINVMERRNDSGNVTYRADDFKEVQRLRDELAHANSERHSTNEYIRNLEQQLLLNKRTDSRSSDREIEDLNNQLREKGNEAKEYKEKLTRMQKIEEELNEKAEKIAVLEKHLKDAESARDKETNSAATMKADFEEKAKALDEKTLEIEALQRQLELERETITQLKEENRLKQNEMEQISAKTDDLYLQLGTICPGTNDSFNDLQQVIEAMKKVVDERLLYQSEIQKLETKLLEADDLLSSHETFKTDISEVLATLDMNGCFARELKLEMTAVRSKSYISNLHNEVKDLFVRLLEVQLKWEEDIEAAFGGHEEYDLRISSDAPGKWIVKMSRKLSALEQEIASLRLKSDEMDELHKIDLEVALDALREDLMKTHEDRLEVVKLEYKEELALKIRNEESAKRDEAIAEERTRISQLEAEIERLKLDINEKLENLTVVANTTQKFEEEIEMHKQTGDDLRQRVAELLKLNTDSTEKYEKEIDVKINHHQEEINEYKEQIHQHALTICAMEERLNLAATRHKDFQTEISTLKSEISALQSKTLQEDQQHQPTELPFQAGPQPKNTALQQGHHHSPYPPQIQNPTPQLKPRIVLHSAAPDVALIQQTLTQVQQENADYAKQLQEQQNCIFALRRDLAGAKARLTDVSGELSETQKQEMEHYQAKIKQQETEVTSLQQQMAKLSDIIDRQTTEIKGLNVEASKQKVIIGKYKNRVKEREVKLNEAASELSRTKTELGQKTSVIDNETAISSELSLQGAQCRGERHEQVIARQQEALAELRAKMRAMEQGNIPLLTQDEAVQQVAILRKEVEELRAMQLPYRRIGQAFGETADDMDPNQMSVAQEISEAFELSENLYLSLLRGIASSLEMDRVGGMRSLLNLPPEERMRLADERQRTCEELTLTVRALRDRVHRKDELLQGYEKDLAKLRRAENLTEMTSGQVQNVMTDLRKKTEEVHCLRESLRRTKDRLEQERRLNSSIKQKKTFHLEHEPVSKNGWPKHHCIQPDGQAEMYAKRKLQNEKRRRQYERELRAKENEIAHHRKLLVDQDNRIQELS